MKGERNRVVMIYVDSYENDVPQGRFCIAAENEVQTFQSLTQLLKKTKEELDKTQFPQSFDEIRKFHDPIQQIPDEDNMYDARPGDRATFAVRILFRQNASWQGSVRWVEGSQEESFRSVLELIMLMDNALSYSENKSKNIKK